MIVGVCLAPTPWNVQQADDTIATTLFVQNAIGFSLEQWIAIQNPVLSFNGRGGAVVLTIDDLDCASFSVPGRFPRAPTPVQDNNSDTIATTAYVNLKMETWTAGVATFNGRMGNVDLQPSDVAAADGLLTTGGTMTGNLTIAKTQPLIILDDTETGVCYNAIQAEHNGSLRWQLLLSNGDPESGTNSGSNFALQMFDNSGNYINQVLSISRQFQITKLNTQLSIGESIGQSSVYLQLNKSASGHSNFITGQNNNTDRWAIQIGDSGAETGGNTGSNFSIESYADNGGGLVTPLSINRATGLVSLRTLAITALPTSDPHIVNEVWNNAGVLNVSAG